MGLPPRVSGLFGPLDTWCALRRSYRAITGSHPRSSMPSNAAALPRATGTVRWFDSAKGHGFVTCDAGGQDCFLHQSSICPEDQRQIEEGTRVAFDVLEAMGGPMTVNVRRL